MSLYFRGNLYENTFCNRVVSNFLTFLYRLMIEIVYYIESYWWKFILLFILFLSLSACSDNNSFIESPMALPHVSPDTCVVDSQSINGHDFMIFYRPSCSYGERKHLEPFQVLHSPDCFCRYKRKFIVVKHE